MVRRTTQDRTNSGIELKIYSTILLHSKEEWITATSAGLLEVKPVYNKEQNTITLNWGSN